MQRRSALSAIVVSMVLSLQPGLANAQSGAPLKVVVGFASGGSVDALGRQVAETLQSTLGRPAIVENRAGAAGRLAIKQVKASPADGNTLLLVHHGPVTLFPHVFKSLKFNMEKDFVSVSRIATGDYALSIGPAVPAKDLPGFMAWVKTAGDKANCGSPGAGTLPHLLGVSVTRAIGKPADCKYLNYEDEYAVVIGRTALAHRPRHRARRQPLRADAAHVCRRPRGTGGAHRRRDRARTHRRHRRRHQRAPSRSARGRSRPPPTARRSAGSRSVSTNACPSASRTTCAGRRRNARLGDWRSSSAARGAHGHAAQRSTCRLNAERQHGRRGPRRVAQSNR
jgi:Tripartite tricarboxylate transporter family receptor